MATKLKFKQSSKILDRPGLLRARERAKAEGRTVVWTNGCFDLLHVGHLWSLRAAKSHGDLLFVGVNSDASVRGLNKGSGRPVIPESQRAELVASLECVDGVLIFDDPTPEAILGELRPDIHVKGAEYAPPHGRPVPEAPIIASYGGRIEYIPLLPSVSTTAILERVRRGEAA
jgi:D-beta-D-heptose 7-phosphate kinase/D-beta-D-heptose 1-phosphate adenosyltransferase